MGERTRTGMCDMCGIHQTYKRTRSFPATKWKPLLTVKDSADRFIVYKGFCLGPDCCTYGQAKEILGESTFPKSMTIRELQSEKQKHHAFESKSSQAPGNANVTPSTSNEADPTNKTAENRRKRIVTAQKLGRCTSTSTLYEERRHPQITKLCSSLPVIISDSPVKSPNVRRNNQLHRCNKNDNGACRVRPTP